MLLASAGTLPFTNGLPAQVSVAAAAAGLHLYTPMMPAASGDTPQPWPQQHKQVSDLGPDPKIVRSAVIISVVWYSGTLESCDRLQLSLSQCD